MLHIYFESARNPQFSHGQNVWCMIGGVGTSVLVITGAYNICVASPSLIDPEAWYTWWCHQMETFSALLDLYVGNSPVTGEFPSQRPVTQSLHVLNCAWINGYVNKREAGDLRRNRPQYNVIVMNSTSPWGVIESLVVLFKSNISY